MQVTVSREGLYLVVHGHLCGFIYESGPIQVFSVGKTKSHNWLSYVLLCCYKTTIDIKLTRFKTLSIWQWRTCWLLSLHLMLVTLGWFFRPGRWRWWRLWCWSSDKPPTVHSSCRRTSSAAAYSGSSCQTAPTWAQTGRQLWNTLSLQLPLMLLQHCSDVEDTHLSLQWWYPCSPAMSSTAVRMWSKAWRQNINEKGEGEEGEEEEERRKKKTSPSRGSPRWW